MFNGDVSSFVYRNKKPSGTNVSFYLGRNTLVNAEKVLKAVGKKE